MLPTSIRITDTAARERPLAAWLCGMAAAMLALGAPSAVQPLLPPLLEVVPSNDEPVPIQDFQLPASSAPEPATEVSLERMPEAEVVIPPWPQVTPPLTPPEVPEQVKMETPPPAPEEKEMPVKNKRITPGGLDRWCLRQCQRHQFTHAVHRRGGAVSSTVLPGGRSGWEAPGHRASGGNGGGKRSTQCRGSPDIERVRAPRQRRQ